ncbi:MAG: hypothetical protein OEU36_20560 [Gammaproteobacteria bacterium]|nr:hypothetical protein [Gammaproteobacteria bacterium]
MNFEDIQCQRLADRIRERLSEKRVGKSADGKKLLLDVKADPETLAQVVLEHARPMRKAITVVFSIAEQVHELYRASINAKKLSFASGEQANTGAWLLGRLLDGDLYDLKRLGDDGYYTLVPQDWESVKDIPTTYTSFKPFQPWSSPRDEKRRALVKSFVWQPPADDFAPLKPDTSPEENLERILKDNSYVIPNVHNQPGQPKYYIEAANHLESVPFRVNEEMLRIIQDLDACPETRLFTKDEEHPADKGKISPERMKRIQFDLVMTEAERLKGRAFWQRVHLDHRGRVYYSRSPLNYQGGDVARSLVEFDQGVELENSKPVLLLHAANTYGNKKGTRQTRLDWAREHEIDMIECANDPVSNDFWKSADSRFCFLRACLEIRDAAPNHVTHLPIELDAANSAYQHFAAITGDQKLARLCNLTMDESESDVYQAIGKKLRQSHDPNLEDGMLRSLVKKVAVPRAYGAGDKTIVGQVADWVKNNPKAKVLDQLCEQNFRDFRGLCVNTRKVVEEVVPAIKTIEDWMRIESNKAIAQGQEEFEWTTYSGFKVVLRPQKHKEHKVTVQCRGLKVQLKYHEYLDELDTVKVRRQLMPALIHSYDAALLHMIVCGFSSIEDKSPNPKPLRSRSIVTVHDAFAVHAPYIDEIKALARTVMSRMYQNHHPLEVFAQEGITTHTPDVPPTGDLSPRDIYYAWGTLS